MTELPLAIRASYWNCLGLSSLYGTWEVRDLIAWVLVPGVLVESDSSGWLSESSPSFLGRAIHVSILSLRFIKQNSHSDQNSLHCRKKETVRTNSKVSKYYKGKKKTKQKPEERLVCFVCLGLCNKSSALNATWNDAIRDSLKSEQIKNNNGRELLLIFFVCSK